MSIPGAVVRFFWPVWIGALVLVFPIPGTIALRNLLLVIGLLALPGSARRETRPQCSPVGQAPAWLLGITTLWLVVSSAWIAEQPAAAFADLRGDWFVPMAIGGIAVFAANRCRGSDALHSVTTALAVHLLSVIAWQGWLWIRASSSSLETGQVPFGERDIHSTLCVFLLAIALGRAVWIWLGSGSNRVSEVGTWFALSISLVADMALRTRNGTIITVGLMIVSIAVMAKRRPSLFALVGAIAILGGTSALVDKRWVGMGESLVVGWNSESPYWRTWDSEDKPATPSGSRLEESAYARAAWARQALDAIVEHPLGHGFGRDAFGRAVELKYGHRGMVSSHSGWLDFALGAGLPGLALLMLTAAFAIRGGWRQFKQQNDPAGLMFAFLVGGYMSRCLLDGHMSGWRLGLFAFLCGILIAAMKPPPKTS